jgi:hypothetical protein
MRRKWRKFAANNGEALMACSGCRKGGAGKVAGNSPTAQAVNNQAASQAQAQESGMVLMEFTGEGNTAMTLRGPRSRQIYRVGGPGQTRIFVYKVDAPQLAQLPYLKIAEPDAPKSNGAVAEPPLVRQAGRKPTMISDAVAVG